MPQRVNYGYQYRPITADEPLDAYNQAVTSYVKQYDETEDRRDGITRALNSVRTSKAGQEYLNNLSGEVNKTLEQVANTIQGTKNWAYGADTVKRLANKIGSDKVFQALQVSQKNYEEGLKTKQELSKKGGVVNIGQEYDDYKPINADGTVAIYSPEWQQEADYVGTASDLVKDVPGTIRATVDKSSIPGYLELHTINEVTHATKKELAPKYYNEYLKSAAAKQRAIVIAKQGRKEGLNEDEIAAKVREDLTTIVGTALDVKAREAYKDKFDLIADDDYRFNRQYEKEKELIDIRDKNTKENDLKKAQYRADLKKSGGKHTDNVSFLTEAIGINNGETGDTTRNGITMVNSKPALAALQATTISPLGKTGWQYVKLNKVDQDNLNTDKAEITSFKPFGVNTKNSFDESFDGALYGTITYKDSDNKEHSVNGLVKSSNANQPGYKILGQLHRGTLGLQNSLPNNTAKATIIDNANPLFTDEDSAPSVPIHLENLVYKDKNGQVSQKIKPFFYREINGKNTKVFLDGVAQDKKKLLGLSDISSSYSEDQLRNLQDNILAKQVKVSALSAKDLPNE